MDGRQIGWIGFLEQQRFAVARPLEGPLALLAPGETFGNSRAIRRFPEEVPDSIRIGCERQPVSVRRPDGRFVEALERHPVLGFALQVIDPDVLTVGLLFTFARPKSRTFTLPSSVTMMLSGLRSRW